MAKPPGDQIPLGGFVLTLEPAGPRQWRTRAKLLCRMTTDAVFERAQRGETINRDALLFFEGRNKVHACFVRDVTNEGPACD
jgi:hypothetical protein